MDRSARELRELDKSALGLQMQVAFCQVSKKQLQESSPSQLADFNRRLIRRLSIETGILERLYDLDRGTTEALVAHGFAEDLVSHSSTNIEPSRLIDILRDQEAAIQLVVDGVSCWMRQRFRSGLHPTIRQQRRICPVLAVLLYHSTIHASQ